MKVTHKLSESISKVFKTSQGINLNTLDMWSMSLHKNAKSQYMKHWASSIT